MSLDTHAALLQFFFFQVSDSWFVTGIAEMLEVVQAQRVMGITIAYAAKY